MARKPDITDAEVEDALAEVYDKHRSEIYDLIYEYADEEGLPEDFLAHLMLDLAVSTRLNAYAAGDDEPTEAGLKADLDRFVAEATEVAGEAKKEAAAFIEALEEEDDEDE
jgi:glycine cleavage system protein P-like pyridoxal-binding family